MYIMRWTGLLLLCVVLLAILRALRPPEPFLVSGTCPARFTFFNDSNGDGFCCNGTIKNKRCGGTALCGVSPGLLDPRTGAVVPTCTQMMNDINASTSGKYCTEETPNYRAPGTGRMSYPTGGCSVSPATGDESSFPLGPDGNRVATPYCLISGGKDLFEYEQFNRQNGVTSCETAKLKESIKCPSSLFLTQDPIDRGGGLYCKSSTPYDSDTGNPHFCIPDETLALYPNRMKDGKELIGLALAKTICASCSHYKKRWVNGDTTAKCVN